MNIFTLSYEICSKTQEQKLESLPERSSYTVVVLYLLLHLSLLWRQGLPTLQ
jgi:hypothetical protein